MKLKRKAKILLPLTLIFLLEASSGSAGDFGPTARPKLILTLVFDQFRGDYLSRFEGRFLPPKSSGGKLGGFRYLMQAGAYYPYGQYDITQSMTGPGHSTILTGAYPYQNGIPSNLWFDRGREAVTYCSEDSAYTLVGAPEKNPHVGTSPRTMNSTTVGDELKNAGSHSRVISLALKDRAAILMGGHRPDLALWFDSPSGRWVSSTYYLPNGKLPGWIDELNDAVHKDQGKSYVWVPVGKSALIPDETHGPAIFRHETKLGSRDSYAMPYGTQLTEQAAERAFEAYHLGRGNATDLLAISFSSHDYAGHEYGPNSREMEEMTVSEDRAVSRLLNFISKRVPLSEVVIVVTGDHGVPPDPDWLRANRVEAGRIADAVLAEIVEKAMDKKYGTPTKKWIGFAHDFNIYFSPTSLKERGVSLPDAEKTAHAALVSDPASQPAIAYVVTSADVESGTLPPGMHARQAVKTFYPGRSADVTIIPRPFYMKAEDTVDHLTGYNYDRTVPIILSGFGIRQGLYADRAEVVDIAPTLTFLAGTIPPSLSEGRVLSEALKSVHH